MRKYIIRYDLYNYENNLIKSGEIKVSNCNDENHAVEKLFKYLQARYSDVYRMGTRNIERIDNINKDFMSVFGNFESNPFW